MNPTTANYDEPWKEALTEYFEAFLHFFFPEVHQLIDWTKIPESLEKELKRITASAIDFGERTMNIDWNCESKCDAAFVVPVVEC